MVDANDKIDYTEKIKTFQAMVDNYNEEIAYNYLTKADWDEVKAAMLFNKDTRGDVSEGNVSEEVDLKEDIPTSSVPPKEEKGFFSKILSSVYSYFFVVREVSIEEENRIFGQLPEKAKSFDSFLSQTKTRIGIMLLYTANDLLYFTKLIRAIRKEVYLMDILKQNFVIFPVLANSSEGQEVSRAVNENILYPSFLFIMNKRGKSPLFSRSIIVDRIEGVVQIEFFRNVVMRCLDRKENDTSSHANVIRQQKAEIEALERMEEEKKRKEKEDKIKAEKEIQEKKLKEEELLKKKQIIQLNIPPEPEADNPDSVLIIIRYPDANRRAERRFLKGDKIKVLYDYVESLGRDIFEDPATEKYDLIQPFPFKTYTDLEKTLYEENLFPNAVLQIREL